LANVSTACRLYRFVDVDEHHPHLLAHSQERPIAVLEQVGTADPFLHVGGDSLKAMNVITRVAEILGV
jgi:hypothetical protein